MEGKKRKRKNEEEKKALSFARRWNVLAVSFSMAVIYRVVPPSLLFIPKGIMKAKGKIVACPAQRFMCFLRIYRTFSLIKFSYKYSIKFCPFTLRFRDLRCLLLINCPCSKCRGWVRLRYLYSLLIFFSFFFLLFSWYYLIILDFF